MVWEREGLAREKSLGREISLGMESWRWVVEEDMGWGGR